jgi:predicted Holliday junction resolvase-like endonuclease
MKSKLLPAILVILIVLNGVLIFMLIKKPHQNREHPPQRTFLTEQLQFSKNQKEVFENLDETHRETMMDLDEKIRKQKDILFNSFGDDAVNTDSLILKNGDLQIKKEKEVFRFFKSVRKICTPEQQEKFDKIIDKALKGAGGERPPRNDDRRLPREGGMPPPR